MNKEKLILNADTLDAALPPAPEAFVADMSALLDNMVAQAGHAPIPRRPARVLVIAAVLLVLLAATALAVGLRLSTQYTQIRDAKNVLQQTYGLSDAAAALFTGISTEEESGTIVKFSPIMYADQLGTYTITTRPGQTHEVTWSHDGEESVGIGALAWDAQTIDAVLALDAAYRDQLSSMIEENGEHWTLEDRAELDSMLLEAGHFEKNGDRRLNILPGPDDIQPDEAIALAKEAIVKTYGLTDEQLAGYTPSTAFTQSDDEEGPVYNITLSATGETWQNRIRGILWVDLRSPSGTVEGVAWTFVDPAHRTLPEGPLDNYEQAVREYIKRGAFMALTHEARAEVADRIVAAGFGALLADRQYAVPSASDLSETEAIVAADAVLLADYGMTPDLLTLFDRKISFEEVDGVRAWVLNYEMDVMTVRIFSAIEKIGSYRAVVNAATGEGLDSNWSMDVEADGKAYTASTWAQAPAWSAEILPYYVEMNTQLDGVYDKYGEVNDWSAEAMAANSQLHRDAGFDRTEYPAGLPGEGELSEADAVSIAEAALLSEFGTDKETLSTSFRLHAFYNVANEAQPFWSFTYIGKGTDASYEMNIDGKTGEVLTLEYLNGGNG